MRLAGTIGPTLAPYRRRTERWWLERSPRERLLLGVLSALLACAIFVGLIVQPLRAMRAADLVAIQAYDMIAARVRTLPPGGAPAASGRSGDIAAIIGSSAPQFGLNARGVPAGQGLRVQLAGVEYDALIRWLADLARTSDVRVARMMLVRAAAPGTVDADLVLVK